MADITIPHTRADGTLIEGCRKGDGVWEILKGLHGNWRYFRSIGQIGLGQSRDTVARDTTGSTRAAEALRAAGHEVTVTMDDIAAAHRGRDRSRPGQRAPSSARKASARRANGATPRPRADYDRARQMAEAIPFGQPVMPDHYSYGRDRGTATKIHDTYGRAFEGMDEAKDLARRAEAAEANQSHRESIPATLRRIEKLEADLRRIAARASPGREDWVDNGAGDYVLKLVTPGPAVPRPA